MKRLLFRAAIDETDLLRNYGFYETLSSIKESAMREHAVSMWKRSIEYEYFSDSAEDLKFDIMRDAASMQYIFRVIGDVPEDIYSYYLLREK